MVHGNHTQKWVKQFTAVKIISFDASDYMDHSSVGCPFSQVWGCRWPQ